MNRVQKIALLLVALASVVTSTLIASTGAPAHADTSQMWQMQHDSDPGYDAAIIMKCKGVASETLVAEGNAIRCVNGMEYVRLRQGETLKCKDWGDPGGNYWPVHVGAGRYYVGAAAYFRYAQGCRLNV